MVTKQKEDYVWNLSKLINVGGDNELSFHLVCNKIWYIRCLVLQALLYIIMNEIQWKEYISIKPLHTLYEILFDQLISYPFIGILIFPNGVLANL